MFLFKTGVMIRALLEKMLTLSGNLGALHGNYEEARQRR
jgi:hypothetical protein